jgi:hypothetical protein
MTGRFAALALASASLWVPAAATATEFPVPELFLWTGTTSVAPVTPARPAEPLLATELERPAMPVARLVWLDPAGIALGADQVAQPAVTELLREMGVEARWRRGDPHELSRPGELRIILLPRPGVFENGLPVLGATPTQFAAEPHVWVHVPSVGSAVGIDRMRPGMRLDVHAARRLGTGLSRVVAHELVHALVPALPHGKGLMSARLDRRMLTGPSVPLDADVGLAVRAALAGIRPVAPPTDSILAAESSREEPES